MQGRTRKVRNVLFGAAVAGAMLFGGSQAVAAPRASTDCTGPGQIWFGTCPGKDCSGYCDGVPGVCLDGCCNCRL